MGAKYLCRMPLASHHDLLIRLVLTKVLISRHFTARLVQFRTNVSSTAR
jgi:hypothetical protein